MNAPLSADTKIHLRYNDPLVVYKACHNTREARVLYAIERMQKMVDALLNHCPDMECSECGKIVCPFGESLHFHHDGCPACTVAEEQK